MSTLGLADPTWLTTTHDRLNRSCRPFCRNQSSVTAAWRAPSIVALATMTPLHTVSSTPRAAGVNMSAAQSASTTL